MRRTKSHAISRREGGCGVAEEGKRSRDSHGKREQDSVSISNDTYPLVFVAGIWHAVRGRVRKHWWSPFCTFRVVHVLSED